MTDYRRSIDLPRWAARSLHSRWCDYLTEMPVDIRDEHIDHVGGIDFDRWTLALMAGLYVVTLRYDDGGRVGLALPGFWQDVQMFDMPARHAGVEVDRIVVHAAGNLDRELAAFLGGDA